MGSRIIRPVPGIQPYPGNDGLGPDGERVDPYGGPTTGDVADAIRDGIARVRGRAEPKTEPRVIAREIDCSQMADETECNECLLKHGYIDKPKRGRYVVINNLINYEYQLYVANLKSAPLVFTYVVADGVNPDRKLFSVDTLFDYLNRKGYSRTVTEWHFNSCEFDGFWPSECTVVETKGNYQHFLDENGDPKWGFVEYKVFNPWAKQMQRQMEAVDIARPQANLEWYFMQIRTMGAAISLGGVDESICRLLPMPGQMP